MGGTATPIKRGVFIVMEGCDRCGKSTQCRLLCDFLKSRSIPAKLMRFPARDTCIGRVINSYLTKQEELSDEAVHLLYSANRWEFQKEMKQLLESGTSLVVDRYSYSNIAYSTVKGLDYDFCKTHEVGLMRPDVVFLLKGSVDMLADRGNFGKERYEIKEFQLKVASGFNRLMSEEPSLWQDIDASESKEEILKKISGKTLQVLQEVQEKPLTYLKW